MRKIIEAEIMSDEHKKIKITLTSGEVIVGRSRGIQPAFDDEGEELDYAVIHIDAEIPPAYYVLRDEDIEKIEKAVHQ